MQNFVELQYLVDGLVNFLESLVFINDSLSSIYYLKKKTRDLDMKKKTLDTVYIAFLKKLFRITKTNV